MCFQQILTLTALKSLEIRQHSCGFLHCNRKNYARKYAYESCDDKFLQAAIFIFSLSRLLLDALLDRETVKCITLLFL